MMELSKPASSPRATAPHPAGEENEYANKFTVKIPNNLLRLNRDEYFTLNVNGFIVIIHGLIV